MKLSLGQHFTFGLFYFPKFLLMLFDDLLLEDIQWDLIHFIFTTSLHEHCLYKHTNPLRDLLMLLKYLVKISFKILFTQTQLHRIIAIALDVFGDIHCKFNII